MSSCTHKVKRKLTIEVDESFIADSDEDASRQMDHDTCAFNKAQKALAHAWYNDADDAVESLDAYDEGDRTDERGE